MVGVRAPKRIVHNVKFTKMKLFRKKRRKVFIFNVHAESKRLKRFSEELEKQNVDYEIISSYNVVITDKKIFYQEKELTFNNGDVVWFVANPMINHYLAEYLTNKFGDKIKMIWPSSQAIWLSDKFYANSFFSTIKIPTPKTVLLNTAKKEKIKPLVDYVGGFPVIIKNCKGSMGATVGIAKSSQEILDFVDNSLKKKGVVPFKKASFILQEFIEESAGADYRVLCLDGKILGGIKRSAQDGGFKANVSLGGKAEIVNVEPKMAKMAKKIMKEGNVFYAGIDFIKSDRGYLALEVNTSAQFKGFEKATGINVAGKIIEALLKK